MSERRAKRLIAASLLGVMASFMSIITMSYAILCKDYIEAACFTLLVIAGHMVSDRASKTLLAEKQAEI